MQCFLRGAHSNPGVPRTENKGSARKFHYNIKTKYNKIQQQTSCGAGVENSTFQYQAKHKKIL
jgi:hypothetical protein